MAYRAIATNGWRFPYAPRNNARTWCVCCRLQTYKDVLHYLWECEQERLLWKWIIKLLQFVIPKQHRNITLTSVQALLGTNLLCHTASPKKWWDIVRGVACWMIWKVCCTQCMDGHIAIFYELVAKVWYKIKVYFRL